VTPTSDVQATRGITPAINEFSPNRKPTPRRKPTDILDETLQEEEPMQMGMQQPEPQRLVPERTSADFGRVDKIAEASGADIGTRLDNKLFSSVKKDPYEYVRVRSNPDLYQQFIDKSSPAQRGELGEEQLSRLQKQSTPVAMPATQAQPPRPKVAPVTGMRRR
jgi:hypothetical protein